MKERKMSFDFNEKANFLEKFYDECTHPGLNKKSLKDAQLYLAVYKKTHWDLLWKVPYIRQVTRYTCWYASTSMVKGAYLNDQSQKAINRYVEKRERNWDKWDKIKQREYLDKKNRLQHSGEKSSFDHNFKSDCDNKGCLGMAKFKRGLQETSQDVFMLKQLYGQKEVLVNRKNKRDFCTPSLLEIYKHIKNLLLKHGPLIMSRVYKADKQGHAVCVNGIGALRNKDKFTPVIHILDPSSSSSCKVEPIVKYWSDKVALTFHATINDQSYMKNSNMYNATAMQYEKSKKDVEKLLEGCDPGYNLLTPYELECLGLSVEKI